jgi:hypothetical protein
MRKRESVVRFPEKTRGFSLLSIFQAGSEAFTIYFLVYSRRDLHGSKVSGA